MGNARGAPGKDFSIDEARRIVDDLFVPNPWIYWIDFLASWALGVGCFALVRDARVPFAGQVVALVVSGLALYRASLFIHELAHLRPGTLPVFRVTWNVLFGIPFLLPSFLYWTHLDHHRAATYGTDRDGEYLPLAHRPPRFVLLYLAEGLIVPVLAIVRFLVLTPLGWLSPRVRRITYERFSSMVIDPAYVRSAAAPGAMRTLRIQETACFLFCLAVAVVPRAVLGRWPIGLVVQGYLTAVFILAINSLRTLGAHRWTNADGRQMTFVEQALDTLNFPRRPWITGLWGPVGLRFHALHHLFPALPYHALPEAHRRLVEHLPADSPYRQTERTSLLGALGELWREARSSAAKTAGTTT